MTTSASKRVKRPRTFDTPRCRIVNPIEEWLVSTAQRPGAKGSETLVGAVVMDRIIRSCQRGEKAGLILVLAGPG
jgi:hypothetical protein